MRSIFAIDSQVDRKSFFRRRSAIAFLRRDHLQQVGFSSDFVRPFKSGDQIITGGFEKVSGCRVDPNPNNGAVGRNEADFINLSSALISSGIVEFYVEYRP
jgi:hypothetical protein